MSLPELRQLRYFVAVADHLSFTTAARELHLAQQSLSAQIARLERTVGARLLDRDTRGTRLTEPGRVFLAEARAVLAAAERAVSTARRAAAGEVGRLRLAFLASTANYMLPLVVRTCRAELPDVAVTTATWRSSRSSPGCGTQRSTSPSPARLWCPTSRRARWPASRSARSCRPGTAWPDAPSWPWRTWPARRGLSWPPWHEKYDRDFAAAGFAPRVVQRAATVPNLLGPVAAGVGVTRLAASARTLRDTGVVFVPIAGDAAETVAAWRTPHPAAERLVDRLARLAAQVDLTAAG